MDFRPTSGQLAAWHERVCKVLPSWGFALPDDSFTVGLADVSKRSARAHIWVVFDLHGPFGGSLFLLSGNRLPRVFSGHCGVKEGKQEGGCHGRKVGRALAVGACASEDSPRPLWPPRRRTRASSSLLLLQKDPRGA